MADDKGFKDELKAGLNDLSGRMSSLADKMKLQLHLGSMEAKQAFEKLEPALERIRKEADAAAEELEGAADTAEVKAHLAFMEVRERWDHVREHVEGVVHDVSNKTENKVKGSFDEARLKSHLASMDAEDAVSERSARARKKIDEAVETVKSETKASLKSLRSTFDDLIKRLD